ncbi:MAG TPA: hypothetical protein VMU56_10300 [Beijerinckiaceae bacterium]|nr:hypothetical protein [Beijerinckiaceae bacterium]
MPASSQPQLEDPAVQAGQLIVRLGMFVLAVATPCAAIVSRRALFSLMPIGAVLILIGAALTPARPVGRRLLASFLTPAGLAAVFLAGWTGLSLAWTPWLIPGGERFFKTIGTFLLAAAAASLLPPRARTSNLNLLPIGVTIAALATIAVAFLGPSWLVAPGANLEGSTLARSAVDLVMLVWPALAALAVRDRWASAGAVAGIAAIAAIAVWTPVALAAMAAGALVFAVSASSPRPIGRVLAIVFGLLFVLAPLLALGGAAVIGRMANAPPVVAPITLWAALVKSDGLRLVTGHGVDAASRGIAAGFLPAGSPRSILFEVWYDLGVIGALAAAALVASAFLSAAQAAQPLAPFLLAALTCGLVIAVAGLSTAQLWWTTLISVVALCFSVVRKGQYRTQRPRVSLLSDERSRPAA